MVRNVTEKRAHDVPHPSADNSLPTLFRVICRVYREKQFFTFVSSIADLGLSKRQGWRAGSGTALQPLEPLEQGWELLLSFPDISGRRSPKKSAALASRSSMEGSRWLLCLFSMSCWLNLMPTAGTKIFHFGPCRVPVSVTEIRSGFTAIKANIQARDRIRTLSILSHPHSLHKVKSSDRCCITHHLFSFYVDKVFKHCKTEDPYVNRKISSIANSFLSVKRKLGQCHEQKKCTCGEESTEKFKQIRVNYEALNVTSAAIKSLGELDILLDWMEKSR
ncbi:interleukin-20-like [Leptosomus discolor]